MYITTPVTPHCSVIGQLMDAIQSGRYDVHKIALILPQTGGGCRASNYIHLLRKALEKRTATASFRLFL